MAVERATVNGMKESLLLTIASLKTVLGPWLIGILPGCYVWVRVDI
jgi:hypothetical protein